MSFMQNLLMSKGLSSLLLFGLLVILRMLIVRRVKKNERLSPMQRKQYIVNVQNAVLFIFLLLLVVIWLEQLRTIAASLMVIAAAIVLATKELILNISGFFFKSSADIVSIGDRIEINGVRGDVIDQSLLGTTLLEIGPGTKSNQHTGLTVFIPNSMFLANSVRNETRLWGDFVFHLITMPIKVESNWKHAEEALLQAANEACAAYLAEAKRNMEKLAAKHSLDYPNVEPRVHIQIVEPEKANLVLRVPVPSRKRGRLEQEISRRYLVLSGENVKAEAAVET